MKEEAHCFREKDAQEQAKIEFKNFIVDLCINAKKAIENDHKCLKVAINEQWKLRKGCDELLESIKETIDQQECLRLYKAFEESFSNSLKKYHLVEDYNDSD
jgi:sarcosine oxidase delta subunit